MLVRVQCPSLTRPPVSVMGVYYFIENCVCGPGVVNADRHNIYANLFCQFNYIYYK